MTEAIIIAIIAMLGTVGGAILGAFATIRAARISAGFGAFPGRDWKMPPSVRRRAVGASIGIAAVLGLMLGVGLAALSTGLTKRVVASVKGDLVALTERKAYSIATTDAFDIRPWQEIPGSAVKLSVGITPGRGKDGALAVRAPILRGTDSPDVATIRIAESSIPSGPTSVVVAWIYVPNNETAKLAELSARFDGFVSNADGAYIINNGPAVALVPGR